MGKRVRTLAFVVPWAAAGALVLGAAPARAQLGALTAPRQGGPASQDAPVTFTADEVDYDKEKSLVTATGHVEAWQNGHVLRADTVTFDRDTGVAAATGHVVLLEPDGEVIFADYAEMQNNMNDGILKDMGALLQQNGRLAANGARRTGGQINELSRAVYTTCNLCKDDPSHPPLWQIRASSGVQDLEHKRIEYTDATLEMYGFPVFYFPYFWHADPSVKRESGLLPPLMGLTSQVGGFVIQPYYLVTGDDSDVTFSPMMTSRAGPELDVLYRQRLNDGIFSVNASAGYVDGWPQGSLAASGQFAIDDTWRWGFGVNHATSSHYVNDFHITEGLAGNANVLQSGLYLEGFGEGSYSRLDTTVYQGLSGSLNRSIIPLSLPRYQYSYFGLPDSLGGRLSVQTNDFNVIRNSGTDTRRVSLTTDYELPATGPLGDQWKFALHGDAAAYDAARFDETPNFAPTRKIDSARGLPQASANVRWPFVRDSGAWGTQLLEPIAEIVVAPQSGDKQMRLYPNEDSLDLAFTDANLFGFNRFTGIDRLDGGTRANAALHAAWFLDGTTFDGLVGQSYRTGKDSLFPEESGLHDQVSDIVARGTFTPTKWLDLTYRTRLDKNSMATHYSEAVAAAGTRLLRVNVGYIYTNFDPAYYYDSSIPPPAGSPYYFPRNEATVGLSSAIGQYRFNGYVRRDLAHNALVAYGADGIYEDECFIFDLRLTHRSYSIANDSGSTAVLFLLTFKTIGQFGYRAL